MVEIMMRNLVKSWRTSDSAFELTVPQFRVDSGEMVAVLGNNGSGKSTFLELVGLAAGPDTRDGVEMRLDLGQGPIDLAALWQSGNRSALAKLRAQTFGYVLQTPMLLPFLSVRGNAELVQDIAGRRDRNLIDHLFAELGLEGRESQRAAELSIGLRQRAAIARALAHRPRFVLADEPTSALDVASADAALDHLFALARNENVGVLLVTHDHARVNTLGLRRVATRIVERRATGLLRAELTEADT